ncbi:MAG: flagellar biosynthesis anti-sigma factor FlgM [Proteobacteria bacterium]|nr:flagellar biosynthesis anti-sigma factor FlgM [Pseudomonadota bacterium]
MKVTETNVNFGRQAYTKGVESTSAAELNTAKQPEPKKEMPEDKVSLSSNAQDMQVAKDAMALAPDIRADKVYEVRSAIDNGSYQINAQKIADKMIGFSIDQMI